MLLCTVLAILPSDIKNCNAQNFILQRLSVYKSYSKQTTSYYCIAIGKPTSIAAFIHLEVRIKKYCQYKVIPNF
jgi:hypothetical protein